MQGVKDASGLYEVERRDCYAARPGFRIVELQISPAQKVPWHYHNKVSDTFYVVEGSIRIFLQDPKEKVELTPGQSFAVPPKRPHLVTNDCKLRSPCLSPSKPPEMRVFALVVTNIVCDPGRGGKVFAPAPA
jgi:mannose-6-phosphate isomerase-like protein (cupin superfamily)